VKVNPQFSYRYPHGRKLLIMPTKYQYMQKSGSYKIGIRGIMNSATVQESWHESSGTTARYNILCTARHTGWRRAVVNSNSFDGGYGCVRLGKANGYNNLSRWESRIDASPRCNQRSDVCPPSRGSVAICVWKSFWGAWLLFLWNIVVMRWL
jgi:hypothetical protein